MSLGSKESWRGGRFAFLRTAVVLLTLAAASLAAGQENAADASLRLVDQAFQKTKTAQTAAEYTEITELLRKAQAGQLSPAKVLYAGKLLGWALNRRGESQAAAADKALDNGDDEQSKRLDAAAAADFQAAVKADPAHWKALHNRGVNFAQEEKYQEALADFTRALEINPKYANTWFNRGEIYYDQGEFEKALADYSEVLALSPSDAGALTGRGHARFRLGRFAEALVDYNQVVSASPKDALARTSRGEAYQGLGQWERAAADYRQAISLDPQLGRAHESAAWLAATCPEERYRNAAQALAAAQKAIELIGEDPKTLDTLAAAQANASRFDEAQATIAKALKTATGDVVARLKQRLELYAARKPYRLPAVTPTRPTSP